MSHLPSLLKPPPRIAPPATTMVGSPTTINGVTKLPHHNLQTSQHLPSILVSTLQMLCLHQPPQKPHMPHQVA